MKRHLMALSAMLFFLFLATSCGPKGDPQPANSATPSTGTAINITSSSASLQVNLSIAGTVTIDAKGVCWSLSQNPTTSDSKTDEGKGTGGFTSTLSGLTASTTYYVRSYVTSSSKTTYGNQISFTTLEGFAITLTTNTVTSVTSTSATSGASISTSGTGSISAKGVCWSKSQNPTIADFKTSNGTGTSSFTSSLTNLEGSTTYYVRAYATDGTGKTSYGSQVSFTTLQAFTATVQTAAVTAITTTSATSGGTISVVGTGSITSRGICWSTTAAPTTSNTKVTSGSGTGTFMGNLTNLTTNTTYYVRAYATDNSGNTTYGNEISFKTSELKLDGLWTRSGNTNVLNVNTTTGQGTWESPYTPSPEFQAVINKGLASASTPYLKNIVKKTATTWSCDTFVFSYTGSGTTATITNVNYIPSTITLTSNGNSFTVGGTVPTGLGYPSSLIGSSFSYTYTRKQ